MPLAAGARLGPYEITAQIGTGGMGEVYRATDSNLGRDVAIKVLPDAVAQDPERLSRFEREAKTLASLNHPNIATIHGLEKANGGRALVMELVEGETLADSIARGPVPIADALPIAKQIAEALEAAHEQGIVHRDLKPANIKIRADGRVKVLDFGLAKMLDPPAISGPSAMVSPTVSVHGTQAGVILGTAAYMSPEQAAGRQADKRSDIWAFGVVLAEMLTGRPVFAGETVSHVLASVLKSDPDLTALPADTPRSIRRLLRRCLEKDRKQRLDSAAAARLDIEDALGSSDERTTTPVVPATRRVLWTIIGAVLLGAALTAMVMRALMDRQPPNPRLPARFAETLPSAYRPWRGPFDRTIALSPDGRHFIYTTSSVAGTGGRLMVRPIDRLEPTPVGEITRARSPFISPDGQWIGFFQDTELKKVPITGGAAISLCRFSGGPRGASWIDSGSVVFATTDPTTGLWRVASGGGEPVALTTPDAAKGEGDHLFPSALPAGRGVLFTIVQPGQTDRAEIALFDFKTNQRRTLIRGGSQAEYVDSGHIVYAAGGSLFAVRFDLATLQVRSDPVPVVEHVRMVSTGAADYAVSRSGTLVYMPGGPGTQPVRSLVWIDRKGHEEPIKAPPRAYVIPRLSPDGGRVALDVRDEENDIWILDLTRNAKLTKLTYGPSLDTNPVWTRDGDEVIFTSNRSGPPHLYRQAADGTGTAEPLPSGVNAQYATSATPDRTGVVGHWTGRASFDIVLFPFQRPGQSPSAAQSSATADTGVQELVRTEWIEFNADLSPNGRYLAYQSNQSGRFEVIVRPFPDVNRGMWTVSGAGATRPIWARSGKELFYRDESAAVIAVPVDTSGPTFTWGSPVKLFDGRDVSGVPERNYDVAPDGRFLMLKESASTTAVDLVVVLDWLEDLKRLIPTR